MLTSLSISISFFPLWCSWLFLISSTAFRLSSSCSRYNTWESYGSRINAKKKVHLLPTLSVL